MLYLDDYLVKYSYFVFVLNVWIGLCVLLAQTTLVKSYIRKVHIIPVEVQNSDCTALITNSWSRVLQRSVFSLESDAQLRCWTYLSAVWIQFQFLFFTIQSKIKRTLPFKWYRWIVKWKWFYLFAWFNAKYFSKNSQNWRSSLINSGLGGLSMNSLSIRVYARWVNFVCFSRNNNVFECVIGFNIQITGYLSSG